MRRFASSYLIGTFVAIYSSRRVFNCVFFYRLIGLLRHPTGGVQHTHIPTARASRIPSEQSQVTQLVGLTLRSTGVSLSDLPATYPGYRHRESGVSSGWPSARALTTESNFRSRVHSTFDVLLYLGTAVTDCTEHHPGETMSNTITTRHMKAVPVLCAFFLYIE